MQHIRAFFLTLFFTLSILLSANLVVTPANASIMDFNFGGLVDYSSPGLSPSFLGQTMSGLIKYNDMTFDSDSSVGVGRYNGAITTDGYVEFSGGYRATLGGSGDNFIEIRQIGSADVYLLRTPVNGSSDYFEISIIHYPSAFSNTLFPPSLGMISQSQFRLVFGNSGPNVVSGSLVSTPLPPAVILFGAGLAALVGMGRLRNRLKAEG